MASGSAPKAKKRKVEKSENDPLPPSPISSSPRWSKELLEAASCGNVHLLFQAAVMFDDGRGLAATLRSVKNDFGREAFHIAAMNGQTEVCAYLVEKIQLDINSLSDRDETPIYLAILNGKHETATYLFHRGANPAISNESGITALHHAAGKGYCNILHFLISRQRLVDLEDSYGITPLHVAAGCRQESATKFLLNCKADPKKVSHDGFTPLMMSVLAGSLQCTEELIEAGADVNGNISGVVTPLGLAAYGGLTEIIECLLKAGADANVSNNDGLKPIEIAAVFGTRQDVEILFSSTFPISSVPDWSIDGIITNLKSEVPKLQIKCQGKKIVSVWGERGRRAFDEKEYFSAMIFYTMAILLDPFSAIIYSNRSCCWFHLEVGDRALHDANICRMLKPEWAKACYREGLALNLLKEYKRAAHAFLDALELEPANKEIEDALREAIESI